MTVFTDQCIPKDLICAIRDAGILVRHASEAQLGRATDTDIFAYAVKQKSVLLTFDKDFGNILRFDIRNAFGVIIIYIDDMTKEQIINNTLNFFNKFDMPQMKGRLFVIEKDKIRAWPR